MTQNSWYFLLPLVAVALISGSVGALLCAGVSAYLNRKPAVGRRVDILPKFEDLYGVASQLDIVISDGLKTYQYSNLHTVEVELANQSRQDFDQFEFGITLSSGDTVIYIEAQPIDRHHWIKSISVPTFVRPQPSVDLVLQPFNRNDAYKFRLLVITTEVCCYPNKIVFSSPLAIRFVDMPTTQETMKKAARVMSLSIGPFKLSFR